MGPSHPISVATLVLAALATVFSFVAMRVASDARELASIAAERPDGDDSYEISQLEQALVRAGVIEDPWVIPDDHGQLDGAWARCLTAAERDAFDLAVADEDLPDCDVVTVTPVTCDLPDADEVAAAREEGIELAETCEYQFHFDGGDHAVSSGVRPEEVVASGSAWFVVAGAEDVDRLVRTSDGITYLHVIGLGWAHAEPA